MRTMIIGFTGYKHSGKSFLADRLCHELTRRCFEVQKLSFASPVKEYASGILEGDFIRVMGEVRGIVPLTKLEWLKTLARLVILRLDPRSKKLETSTGKHRFLLQRLGTDVFRRHVNPNYWVMALEASIEENTDIVVIDDVRFQNEADICDLVIRVIGVEESGDGHASENPDGICADMVVDNTSRDEVPSFMKPVFGHIRSHLKGL